MYTQKIVIKEKYQTLKVLDDYNSLNNGQKNFRNGLNVSTPMMMTRKIVNVSLHTEMTLQKPQHNSLSESENDTIVEPVHVMLEEAGMSAKYLE